jgi:hypothetical protein
MSFEVMVRVSISRTVTWASLAPVLSLMHAASTTTSLANLESRIPPRRSVFEVGSPVLYVFAAQPGMAAINALIAKNKTTRIAADVRIELINIYEYHGVVWGSIDLREH